MAIFLRASATDVASHARWNVTILVVSGRGAHAWKVGMYCTFQKYLLLVGDI